MLQHLLALPCRNLRLAVARSSLVVRRARAFCFCSDSNPHVATCLGGWFFYFLGNADAVAALGEPGKTPRLALARCLRGCFCPARYHQREFGLRLAGVCCSHLNQSLAPIWRRHPRIADCDRARTAARRRCPHFSGRWDSNAFRNLSSFHYQKFHFAVRYSHGRRSVASLFG